MKTQNEFLEALEEELRFLKGKEIHEILKHYREKIDTEIDYGTPEEKIIKNLPLPADIANDIYKARGISFLEIQKKKYRKKEIIRAILSAFIIAFMTILFIGVSSFLGYITFNFNKLFINLSSFKESLDIILIAALIITLDIVMISIFVFIIDLFYIIITTFLLNILKASKKTYRVHYKFQDFTISGAIKDKCKKKNVVAIILASSAALCVIIFGASLFTKGYIYRSFNNIPLNNKVLEYDSNIKNISIAGSNANIRFEIDEELDHLKVTYNYEFNQDVPITLNDSTLSIDNVGSQSFGLFGLLDEPYPNIIFTLPSAEYLKELNIKLDAGSIYLKEIQNISLKVNVDIYDSQVYLENTNLKELAINGYKTDVKLANLDKEQQYFRINNLNITSSIGSIAMEGMSIDKFVLKNINTDCVIKKCQINDFDFETNNGKTIFYEVCGKTLNYVTRSANNILDDITYTNAYFEANRASSISVTRLMVQEKLTLTAFTGGSITISRLKATETLLSKSDDQAITGNIILNYVNRDDIIGENDPSELVESKNKYNAYKVVNTKISGSSEGSIYINRSTIEEINIKQTSAALQVSDSEIVKKATFDVDTAKNLTFTDVTGTDIHFVLKHTKLVYYNSDNNLNNTKCYVKFIGASYGIDSNIKPEVEQGE